MALLDRATGTDEQQDLRGFNHFWNEVFQACETVEACEFVVNNCSRMANRTTSKLLGLACVKLSLLGKP